MSDQRTTTNPATIYDDFLVPALFAAWAREQLSRVPVSGVDRVLDIACGTGAVTEPAGLRAKSGEVIELDISEDMLGVARSHSRPAGASISWVEGDASDLPFERGRFDVVLCQQGIQFAADRDVAAREMHRVLRPGGRLGVSVWSEGDRQQLIGALYLAIERRFGRPANSPFAFGTAESARAVFERAGFHEVRAEAVQLDVRFTSLERLVRLTVLSTAAVLPELASASDAERERFIGGIRSETAADIAAVQDGDSASFITESHIITASA